MLLQRFVLDLRLEPFHSNTKVYLAPNMVVHVLSYRFKYLGVIVRGDMYRTEPRSWGSTPYATYSGKTKQNTALCSSPLYNGNPGDSFPKQQMISFQCREKCGLRSQICMSIRGERTLTRSHPALCPSSLVLEVKFLYEHALPRPLIPPRHLDKSYQDLFIKVAL